MGCLTLPFKLLAGLLLVAALALGWLYRDRLLREARTWLPHWPETATAGRPGAEALERARDKVDSMNAWRTDSIVLDASEAASLLAAGLDSAVRWRLDSLSLELREDAIGISAHVRTEGFPREALGIFSGMLEPSEPMAAAGPLRADRPGWAAWRVEELAVRNLPLPRDVVPRLVDRALGGGGGAVPLPLPEGVGGLRVRPLGITFYRRTAQP